MIAPPLIDIGANLTDQQYQGVYNQSKIPAHPGDLPTILQRASASGVGTIIITAGSADESEAAVALRSAYSNHGVSLRTTVGCHPTRCGELVADPLTYLGRLRSVIEANRDTVVAIGECGLDYDRTQFCPIEVQREFFPAHFQLAREYNLPMFLHNRNTGSDFVDFVRRHRTDFSEGVVHSFTGSEDEMKALVNLGLYIGINGCSLKTTDNCRVASLVPLDRVLIETDAPWCDIRPTHASYSFVKTQFESVKKEKYMPTKLVKGRNEPCALVQVLEVLHGLHAKQGGGPSLEQIRQIVFQNTMKVFKL